MNCTLCGRNPARKVRPYIYDSGEVTFESICLQCAEEHKSLTEKAGA